MKTLLIPIAIFVLAACAYEPSVPELSQAQVDQFILDGDHPTPRTDITGHCDGPGEFGVMMRDDRFGAANEPVPVRIGGYFNMCVADYIRRKNAGERVDNL